MNNQVHTKNCEHCGSPFHRSREQGYSHARFARMRFCGKRCSGLALAPTKKPKPRRGKTLTCPQCKNGFYVRPALVKSGAKFCSQSCFASSLKTNRPLNCLLCGAEFYVSRSQEKARNRGCCSLKCRAKYYARRGERNPFWRGGVSSEDRLIRYSTQMKEWRKAVFERDNYICQSCGARSGKGKPVHLHAHHIKQFAFYPDLRFEVSNGLTLCKDCHHSTKHERNAA